MLVWFVYTTLLHYNNSNSILEAILFYLESISDQLRLHVHVPLFLICYRNKIDSFLWYHQYLSSNNIHKRQKIVSNCLSIANAKSYLYMKLWSRIFCHDATLLISLGILAFLLSIFSIESFDIDIFLPTLLLHHIGCWKNNLSDAKASSWVRNCQHALMNEFDMEVNWLKRCRHIFNIIVIIITIIINICSNLKIWTEFIHPHR